MLKTTIGRLRLIGFAEGVSMLVLLFIAMPLKYFGNNPEPVRVVGWIHGLLFVIFMVACLIVCITNKWPFKKLIFAFLAALLPFGTFVFDAQLKKEQAASR